MFFHLSYLILLMAYLFSQRTPNVQIKYFMFDREIYRLCKLNKCCKGLCFDLIINVYIFSTWVIVELTTRFETLITWNDVNGLRLFHLSYLITLKAYLCSQRTPNVQINYFIFDWSFYRLFVLKRGWKRDCLQIMTFIIVCLTWCIVELKTRLDTWITRYVVNGVSLFTFLIL
jgi:hypothetical protein